MLFFLGALHTCGRRVSRPKRHGCSFSVNAVQAAADRIRNVQILETASSCQQKPGVI